MNFRPTAIDGVVVIDVEPRGDDRGLFARTFCEREFREHGLCERFVQSSLSHSRAAGTLRGLHCQRAPAAEVKLVSCVRGAIFDVALDLRPGSPTLAHWVAAELTADNRRMLYVPEGCAHGFLTLADATEVAYRMSAFFVPDAATGVRWDDPAFGIEWPGPVTTINERDRNWPDFVPARREGGDDG